jgi:uncharacterized Fe-S center protein
MKSKVFFVPLTLAEPLQHIQEKLQQVLDRSQVFENVTSGSTSVIKIHFGEEGNTGFVRPAYVRAVCESLVRRGATVQLSDSNTLYKGRRSDSAEHTKLALEHGFTKEETGATIAIANEAHEDEILTIPINQKHIKEAKIPRIYKDCDLLVSLTHFKGHMMSGVGGTLKNLGMGCATREGKMAQHSEIAPDVQVDSCVGCGACVDVCPVDAITIDGNKAVIRGELCIGCASCIAACENGAMEVNWASGSASMVEKMVEYAKAVLDGQQVVHISFVTAITAECDCMAQDDPRIAPDVGVLVSTDPVAIDQASYDLVLAAAGHDVFRQAHPRTDSTRQLSYAERLHLGKREYELVKIDV